MLINPHFLQHKKACIIQTSIALVFIIIVLCLLDTMSHTMAFRMIGATSLSASAFTVFAACDSSSARSKHILVGYLISLMIGLSCYLLSRTIDLYLFSETYLYTYEIFGAIALALSLLFMVLLNVPHPPAAGFSVGIVIDVWDADSLLVIMSAVIVLAILKTALKNWLINLT